MVHLFLIAALFIAFFLLGKAADIVVVHIRHIGERLGIGTVFLGLLLGLFTTLPEFALAINAFANGVEELSFGNLVGGIPVLLGLILGLGAVLNRKINTKEMNGSTPFMLAFLLLPLLLGLDGRVGMVDGVVLILFYLLLGYALYAWNRRVFGRHIYFRPHRFAATDFFLVIGGIILVLLISNGIIRITLELLALFQIPAFLVGVLLFAIGTNLPELSVTIRAWRRGASDLSMSHLLGSAMANGLLIGILAFIHVIPVTVNTAYVGLAVTTAFLLGLLFLFGRTDNRLSRREGFALVGGYLLVVASQALIVL